MVQNRKNVGAQFCASSATDVPLGILDVKYFKLSTLPVPKEEPVRIEWGVCLSRQVAEF
jgi:hypothetical protein